MADVKLFQSQRLTDNPDGGGLATANEVVDGEINNLFDDVSRIDRVNGDLSLRKVFPQAATADTGLYSGLHLIVQAPPMDPRVSAVLFKTGSWADERNDAKNQVERYLDESVPTRLIPYDRQLQGQRTVLVYTRPELSLPEIGEVYALKNDDAETVEFFRIQDVDHQEETFTDGQGDYKVRVITLTISQPLSREFSGSQPNRFFVADASKSVIRRTIASDAARYKGVVALAEDADAGDLSIKVNSVFMQLVPAANSESSITDASPSGSEVILQAASAGFADSVSIGSLSYTPVIRYLSAAVLPGSLVVTNSNGTLSVHDDGFGKLISLNDSNAEVGTINYANGLVTYYNTNFTGISNATWVHTYTPAVQIAKASLSVQIAVDISNRGYVYNTTLRPIPVPGATKVSFRALGKWYELQDDGSGALIGDAGVGTGLVNFTTGTVSVSLGALPDIDSSVIFNFGASSEYEIRDADVAIPAPSIGFTLEAGNCEPSTLSISWLAGATTKTATDDGDGLLTGDATGSVVYGTGQVVLRPTLLANPSTNFVATYEAASNQSETYSPTLSGGYITITAANAPVREKSIKVSWAGYAVYGFSPTGYNQYLVDNGAGQLVDNLGNISAGSSVNYTTGVITFSPNFPILAAILERNAYSTVIPGRSVYTGTGFYENAVTSGRWASGAQTSSATAFYVNGSPVVLTYKEASATDVSESDTFSTQPLKVDLTPLVSSAIVPGSVLFSLGGRNYYDRQGTLYYGINYSNGSGTATGTINYSTGEATLTSWVGNTAPVFDVKSLLTQVRAVPLPYISGRAPGSPLRPSSFYIQATRFRDGTLISAIADNNGNITTAQMHGYIDVNTGVFSVAFGAYVLDSSLSSDDKAENWYDAANVDGDGYIWRPDEVVPGTVRFNCVVLVSLPQDPEIIGVNPVRLPTDGRVQAIRAGDTLVIHDTQPYTMPDPLDAGDVVSVGRTDLASVALYDQDGLGVDTALYTADLEAGEITMATPLDLSGYNEPLVALHTIEDMALCLDAQITGQVTLGEALTRSYTADNSYCSAALVIGDVQGRYENLFVQATWTGVFSDTLIGSSPISGADYNDVTFPIQVLNRDVITQRWALVFTSSTVFNVVSEELGIVGTGSISAGAAPLNPASAEPYFEILAGGFGTGWSTGNVVRFNTVAAGGPVWIARTVRSGPATELEDRIRIQVRWDKD